MRPTGRRPVHSRRRQCTSAEFLGAARIIRLVLLLATAVGLVSGCTGSPLPEPTVREPSPFVQRDGIILTRSGHPFRFTGMNVYHAASTGECGDRMTGGGLDAILSALSDGSGGSAKIIRVWFFQPLATKSGQRDWSAMDEVVQTARARGFLVIPTLGNHWEECDGSRGSRTEDWYAAGYRSGEGGNIASYRSWVAEVVGRYRNDPTVAFWQLMNEAETSTAGRCSGSAAATLQDFTADVSAVIKSVDGNHLVSVGTIGTGQCGAASEDYAQLHALPDVDLCEYHDYRAVDQPMPGDEFNGLQRRLSQCVGLGKPLFIGEAGIPARLGLSHRAELFQAKIQSQFAAGVVGYLPWAWSNPGGQRDEFAIGPRDPLLSVLSRYDIDGANPQPAVDAAGPPMGFNHYNSFGTEVSEETIREVSDAMVGNGMRDAGYQYVNLDDGWQAPRDADGNLTANARFPSGIKALADYVHARGLRLGIYTTPTSTSCGGRPGSAGNTERDVATFAAWQVDFIKLDWCGADYSPAGAQRIARRWRSAIASTGRPMVLSINAGGSLSVPTWASRSATMWRTGDDICASWFNKTRQPSPAAPNCWTRRYHNGILDYLESSTEKHQPYVGPGRWADPDMLEVGNPGLTDDEARTHFGLWAMWSAPLLSGNDPRTMTPTDATSATLLNPDAIAIDQDRLTAMATTVHKSDSECVWLKPLSNGRFALLLANLSETPRNITINWSDVGVHGRFLVRDVWDRHDGGPISPQFRAVQVPPHGSVLLLLSPTA